MNQVGQASCLFFSLRFVRHSLNYGIKTDGWLGAERRPQRLKELTNSTFLLQRNPDARAWAILSAKEKMN